jgi:hypothetical protein
MTQELTDAIDIYRVRGEPVPLVLVDELIYQMESSSGQDQEEELQSALENTEQEVLHYVRLKLVELGKEDLFKEIKPVIEKAFT